MKCCFIVQRKPKQLKRNKLVRKVKVLKRGWSLSFAIKPTGVVKGWSNIMHATLGKNSKRYGDRTPGVWFISGTTKLHICSAVSGNRNRCYNSAPLPKKKFSRILIRQIQKRNFKYYYQIFINGKKKFDVLNTKPKVFKNVKYYASDPWYKAAKAQLRNMKLRMFRHKGEKHVF